MKKFAGTFLYITALSMAIAASPTLSVLEWQKDELVPWPVEYNLTKAGNIHRNNVSISLTKTQVKQINEWRVVVENKDSKPARLCFRLSMPCGDAGGVFWDGFQIKTGVVKTVSPKTERYIFPAVAYVNEGVISGAGYAPMTISSRFERSCQVNAGKVTLNFDSYMALDQGQKDEIYFIDYKCNGASDYTELVEQVYLSYPEWFRPAAGADQRIYGVGGYFFSSENNREYQMEEARRYGFDWEWYYNCYQKAGNFYPKQELWEDAKGYKSEAGSLRGKCDRPGTIKDWRDYNKTRIDAGNKNAAMFYYYLQQYCSSELLKGPYADAIWQNSEGKAPGPVFGWADEGNAQYAWPLHSKLGNDMREQLAMLWRDFPIAGFALDCALGHTKYYGPLLKNETGKAFDDHGRIYATEGTALAYNLDFTRNLPAKADGRKPASVINEFYTWLPMFHADGGIHEMSPFDRADLLAPRRLIAGQKPYYFWKGFRAADTLLKWNDLTVAETREGITGIIDYTLLSSLRFGIIPAVFYLTGFADIKALNPVLKTMLKAGWRAAGNVSIDGRKDPADPFALNEDIWISRYGNADESYIVLSAPDIKGMSGKAIIHTGKFGASGAIYADINGKPIINEVNTNETVINFELKNREPLILGKIAVLNPAGKNNMIEASCSVEIPGRPQTARFRFMHQPVAGTEIIKDGWPRKSSTENEVIFEKAQCFKFIPNDGFVADIVFGDNKKIDAAIAVDPEYREKNPDTVKHLEIYYDYYISRIARPLPRLADMTPYWNKKIQLPVLVPDSKELKNIKLVFILGEKAQKILMPDANYQDAILCIKNDRQLLIGFFPGKNISEYGLVMQLLERMDEKYPFIGGINAQWAPKAKLSGKVFKK